jgi:hypothetical protein
MPVFNSHSTVQATISQSLLPTYQETKDTQSNKMYPTASDKAFEEAAARVILKNPNGFGFKTEGIEVARKLSSLIVGKSGTSSGAICSHKQLIILSVLITGVAEGGVGAEAAVSIAHASPKLLVLSARSKSRASPVADKIAVAYPTVKVEILEMDLGFFTSVRNTAKKLDTTLDVLICNAGIMAVPYGKTEDGFEKQFAVNHLGHFLFTNLLLKEGKIRDDGRIVIVTSDGHRLSDVLWEDTGFQV